MTQEQKIKPKDTKIWRVDIGHQRAVRPDIAERRGIRPTWTNWYERQSWH